VSIQRARRLLVAGAGAMLLVLAATTDVAAMTYCVSPSGSDGSPGSAASPWERTGRAYREMSRPASFGSGETARITYPAAPGEQA
jgi:hypothetical protein